MKLFRFGAAGAEKPGVAIAGSSGSADVLVDASSFGEDWNERFFESDGLARLVKWVAASASAAPRVPAGVRLGPAVARPSKIVCIGLNYRAHALETKAAIPAEPIVFLKATTALAGPNDDIVLPRGSTKTDWEVELALVVGARARYVERADAMKH
ncbi:MAG TPA: fumarylacetoacetate hydrolase family protein, partial [Polyangia bacterium]|nr:fumarylacetoacetate hydrolase family protein [Polyangia bacterium]